MDNEENKGLADLATNVRDVDGNIEYHPSIRNLVKILARKAAEERYDEFLKVLKDKHGDDIEKE